MSRTQISSLFHHSLLATGDCHIYHHPVTQALRSLRLLQSCCRFLIYLMDLDIPRIWILQSVSFETNFTSHGHNICTECFLADAKINWWEFSLLLIIDGQEHTWMLMPLSFHHLASSLVLQICATARVWISRSKPLLKRRS